MTPEVVLIAVLLPVSALFVWCATKLPLRQLSTRRAFALWSPFLFPFVIVAWGVLFWWHGPQNTQPRWHDTATTCLFLLYPGICAFSIWSSRGFRWFAAGLLPLSLFFNFLAALWTAAAITGD